MEFALPLMLGNIFQQLYNLTDSKIVSAYVSENAFAAVGATAVVSNMLISFISGLTQGFSISVAKCFGAGDRGGIRRSIAGTVVLTTITTVILYILGFVFIRPVLELLHTPAAIMDDSISYVRIIIAGLVFCSLYNLAANVLRGVGDSLTPLICLIISVVLNIGLDLLAVCVLGLGIRGAAYATVCAQAVAGIICVCWMIKRIRDFMPGRSDYRISAREYGDLLSFGLAMALMNCIVNIGTVILQRAINVLGTTLVVAHLAARRVFDLIMIVIFTIGLAMTTYIGQNLGARRFDRIRLGVKHAMILVTLVNTVIVGLCHLFGRNIIEWVASTENPLIVEPAVMYLNIGVELGYVLGPLFVLRCSLQGMGHRIIPVVTSILELIIKAVFAFVIIPYLGYFGVAITEPFSWCVMDIVLIIGYIYAVLQSKKQVNETA